jgi:hypothetical protein
MVPASVYAENDRSDQPRSILWTGDDPGWTAGFADYPPGVEKDWNFASSRRPLPAPLTSPHQALFIGGDNHSDDLFMFWKRRITGLVPGRYAAELETTFATNAPRRCQGVGGAPGEAVYVKLGLAAAEPLTAVGPDGAVRVSTDKGNQANGGKEAQTVGDVSTTNSDCAHRRWELKSLRTANPLMAKTDSDGSIWPIVGTDSGYEARSEIYYASVAVTLRPVSP